MKQFAKGLGVSLILMAAIVVAQSGTPGSSLSLSLAAGNTCAVPAPNVDILCGTTTGLLESHNGSALAPIAGSPGPAGPQGPAGATGPQGPAGTLPSAYTCTSMTITATGASFSGCK